MTVYGLSQSNGVERKLEVERSDTGVLFHVHDMKDDVNRERIVIPAETLLNTMADIPDGGTTIEGVSAENGKSGHMDLDVRGNEVLLRVRPESGGEWDIAVGLDDFQDAVEAAVGSA